MKKIEDKFNLSEAQEEYLKMYHEYFVLNWSWADIRRYHNCSKAKVTVATRWVIDNRLNMPSLHLIKGAIDAISVRIKINKDMYDKEVGKKRYRDNNFIIALSKEMRDDEKTLYKLQEVYNGDDEDKDKLTPGQVLKLIREASLWTGPKRL